VIRGRWQGFRAGDAALGKAVCFGFAAVFVSPIRIKRVPNRLDDLRYDIALASRMLAHENVLDAFGHVSMRHPTDPGRYLLSRSRSPQLLEPDDILEYTLDSEPVKPPISPMFAERVIHGCIYEARPDVMAVCHHHAAAVLPFCVAAVPIEPVFHLGAASGETTPFWDQQDEFGDTNLLVRLPEEGRSLARALGQHSAVLLNRHGATVVGTDIRELVSRCIFMCQNAVYQLQAHLLGRVDKLRPGEVKLASTLNSLPNVTGRTWEYWTMRLAEAGRLPPAGKPKSGRTRPAAKAKRASAKTATRGRKRR
jgi:ribulose-5-phosphate 4-epimerase/fuculose-1-phosphate aldolase